MSTKPTVLFVCLHNAGRSQMAAGWLRHLAGDAVEVRSAGSEPADQINPAAVQAMREVGIDITDVFLTLENEGVEKFEKSWTELLETVNGQLEKAKG